MPRFTTDKYTGGAVGAGLVLVVLPSVALYFGMELMSRHPVVGLPLLAIFGIMMLFGSMALTATLFARLGLSNKYEALALPAGSIRAAIALSLIVLFAIIAIMLFQSQSKPYLIPGLSKEEMNAIVLEPRNRVLAVYQANCLQTSGAAAAASAPVVPASGTRNCYDVHLVQPAGQDATDIAKQLLILVGTLMTSVTSFYFASRTAVASASQAGALLTPASPAQVPNAAAPSPAALAGAPMSATPAATARFAHTHDDTTDSGEDGCDVPIVDATPDENLPPSQGGVA